MKKSTLFLIAIMLSSIALIGCIEQLTGSKPASSLSPTPFNSSLTSPTPKTNAPSDLLEDNLEQSIAELEIVG